MGGDQVPAQEHKEPMLSGPADGLGPVIDCVRVVAKVSQVGLEAGCATGGGQHQTPDSLPRRVHQGMRWTVFIVTSIIDGPYAIFMVLGAIESAIRAPSRRCAGAQGGSMSDQSYPDGRERSAGAFSRANDALQRIRAPYASPRLIVHGSLRELTKASGTTNSSDGGTRPNHRTGAGFGPVSQPRKWLICHFYTLWR